MSKILTLILLITATVSISLAQGSKYVAIQPGKWDSKGVWADKIPDMNIADGDTVVLSRNIILEKTLEVYGVLIIEEGVTIYSSEALLVSSSGIVENKGQLMLQAMENNGLVNNYSKLEVMEGVTGMGSMQDINGISTAGIME